MKKHWFLLGACLACSSLHAKTLWSDNSITLLKGNHYTVPYTNDSKDAARSVVTFEHVSGQSWGDVFFFLDRLESADEHNETYAEFSPRLSLGKVSGKSFSWGPVKDVLVSATAEWTSVPNSSNDATNYLVGPAIDLDIPGFSYFQLNAYYRDNDKNKKSNWQLTPVWAVPFSIGSQAFLYDGFIDWRSGNSEVHEDLNFTSQLKWDVGQAVFKEKKVLYVGIEYVYWRNKFGLEDGLLPFKTNESNVNALIKFHF